MSSFLSKMSTLLWFIFQINASSSVSYIGPADQTYFLHESFDTNTLRNLTQLTCNNIDLSETTKENPVVYYKLNITATLRKFKTISISTCCDNPASHCQNQSLDTYLYLFSLKRNKIILLETIDDINTDNSAFVCSNSQKSIIDITSYIDGQYIIGIGGFDTDIGKFHIELNCVAANTLPTQLGVPVFIVIAICVVAFAIFYHLQRRKYYLLNPIAIKSINSMEECEEINMNRTTSMAINIAVLQAADESETDNSDTDNITNGRKSISEQTNEAIGIMSANTERRVLGGNETREDLVAKKEDVILALLGHIEASCTDEHGLDVYQVLAIRAMDKESNKPKLVKPLKQIGCNIECIKISEYHTSLFIAIITILLQTMGITVVVYKLLNAYFKDSGEHFSGKCSMDTTRWNAVYSLKILSFLWSLVITISIGSQLGNVERNGVYRMVTELKHEEIASINYINFWWIRIGQILNYYACLLSVIGSFFIIFETNSGEELSDGSLDYSHSGLDMVLNAVALFFMLELDDCLVSYQDFRDMEHIIHRHFENREKYVDSRNDLNVQTINRNNVNGNQITNKNIFKIKYCANFTEFIAFFVKFWLYAVGIFAPIAVFLCY